MPKFEATFKISKKILIGICLNSSIPNQYQKIYGIEKINSKFHLTSIIVNNSLVNFINNENILLLKMNTKILLNCIMVLMKK